MARLEVPININNATTNDDVNEGKDPEEKDTVCKDLYESRLLAILLKVIVVVGGVPASFTAVSRQRSPLVGDRFITANIQM